MSCCHPRSSAFAALAASKQQPRPPRDKCARGGAACAAGLLQPLAYSPAPDATTLEVMDLLVGGCVAAGTALGFKFYPHDDGYQSPLAVTVTFVTRAPLCDGLLLRLAYTTAVDVSSGMTLYYRHRGDAGAGAWRILSSTPSAIQLPPNATCIVFLAPFGSTAGGCCGAGSTCTGGCCGPTPAAGTQGVVCAIGLHTALGGDPVMPPPSVVPCAFQTIVDAPDGSDNYTWYAPSVATAFGYGVPTQWRNAWQLLQCSSQWQRAQSSVAPYDAAARASEDLLFIRLNAGAVAVVAYKPYDTLTPDFPAELAFVTLTCMPPGTVLAIAAGAAAFAAPSPAQLPVSAAWWTWTSPTSCPLPAGTVVALRALGPTSLFIVPTASVGTIAVNAAVAPQDAFDFLVYSGSVDAAVTGSSAVAAVYTCGFRGALPATLIPGSTAPAAPWPRAPSIISLGPDSGRARVAIVTSTATATAAAALTLLLHACPSRWLCQLLPVSLSCGACCDAAQCTACA